MSYDMDTFSLHCGVSITYQSSITDPLLSIATNGILNDLVSLNIGSWVKERNLKSNEQFIDKVFEREGSPYYEYIDGNDILVTHFLPFPHPALGGFYNSKLHLFEVLNKLIPALGIQSTEVLHCQISTNKCMYMCLDDCKVNSYLNKKYIYKL